MTQIPTPALPANMTPEQMQQMIAYLLHQQASMMSTSSGNVGAAHASSASSDLPIESTDVDGGGTSSTVSAGGQFTPQTPVRTPPRKGRQAAPPSTPKARGNTTPMKIIPPSPATKNTPSSKMAQLTLDGRKLSSTPSVSTGDDGIKGSGKKVLPTGQDPMLVFDDSEHETVNPERDNGGDDDNISSISDEFPSNPMDAFPRPDTGTDEAESFVPSTASSGSRRKRNEPTMPRWINTRGTTSNHEPSPLPVYRSAKKNARVASPTDDNAHSPVVRSSPKKKARIASPFESPPQVKTSDKNAIKEWLDAAPPGIRFHELEKLVDEAPSSSSPFIDDEAMAESDGYEDHEDTGSDLADFIQPDDVIDYDEDAPALPDDEDAPVNQNGEDASTVTDEDDAPTRRRIHRRIASSDEDTGESDIEIVPTPSKNSSSSKGKARASSPTGGRDVSASPSPVKKSTRVSRSRSKGKGRATSPPGKGKKRASSPRNAANRQASRSPDKGKRRMSAPPEPSGSGSSSTLQISTPSTSSYALPAWKTRTRILSRCPRGLHPGSSPIGISARLCPKLTVDATNPDDILSLDGLKSRVLENIDYYEGLEPVPSGCALVFDGLDDNVWDNPDLDDVLSNDQYVHVNNVLSGLKLVQSGPFVNWSLVDHSKIIAAEAFTSINATRYRTIIKDTRAPVVSLTLCVVRFWRVDRPSTGQRPVFYVNVSPMSGLFDRDVAAQCVVFGRTELHCLAFRNAIRIASLPSFDRPPAPTSTGKTSSAIRVNNSTTRAKRIAPFEPSSSDTIPVYNARYTELPDDISTWTTALPVLEGPLPTNAVAFVAHTTNAWVGNRAGSSDFNVQYNLMYIIVVGVLPPGNDSK